MIDQKEVFIQRRKTMALLAYLAIGKRSFSRDELTELFYPEQDRDKAKADFRQILSALRKVIGSDFLVCDRFSISLDFSREIIVDVHRFLQLVDNKHSDISIENLKEAVSLYQGPLMAGFFLDNNYLFENWQLSMQDKLLDEYTTALDLLTNCCREQDLYHEAISYCKIRNEIDPLNEETVRELMELYHYTEQRKKISETFSRYKRTVLEEIGEEPEGVICHYYNRLIHEKSMHRPHNNLPDHKARLIGREKELQNIINLIRDENYPLVSLIGVGGTGKTLLALHASEQLLDFFPEGVFFIDLSGMTKIDEATSSIKAHLKIADNRTAGQNSLSIIQNFLRRRRVLLVLDNFEQLQEGKRLIKSLLSHDSPISLLITSRIEIGISEEKIFRIPPLQVSGACCTPDHPMAESGCEAMDFFKSKAALYNPDFTMNHSNCLHVWEICKQLDGLPLAIELAVSRLNILNCREIRNRLAGKLELLANHNSILPERQRTMKSAIEWSFKLLKAEEQELFIKLSIFQGSSSMAAIESMSGYSILDRVSSLIRNNMIYKREKAGETRYCMLETLREYSKMKLAESGKMEETAKQQANYFYSLATEAEPHFIGPDLPSWINRLQEDDRNFIAAIEWFRNNSQTDKAIQMAICLQQFWYYSFNFNNGKKILGELLEAGKDSVDKMLLGRGYCSLGWMSFVTGEWQQARMQYRSALVLNVLSEDRITQSLTMGRLGVVERWIGEKQSGLDYGRESVEIARELENPYFLAVSLIYLYCTRGGIFEGDDPLPSLKEALNLSEEIDDHWCLIQSLSGLGDYYRERKEYERAEEYYNKSLSFFSKQRDLWAEAWVLGDMGMTIFRKGEPEKGIEYLRKSILQLDSIGDRGGIMMMLSRMAIALAGIGIVEQAVFYMAAAQKQYDSLVNFQYHLYSLEGELQKVIEIYKSDYEQEWLKGLLMDYDDVIESISNFEISL